MKCREHHLTMQGHLPFSLIGHSEDGDIQKLLHSTNRCSDPNENDTAVPLCPIYIPNHSRILESTSTRLYFCSEILGTLELIYWRNFCLTRMGCAAPTLINTINESYQKKKKTQLTRPLHAQLSRDCWRRLNCSVVGYIYTPSNIPRCPNCGVQI